MTRVVIHDDDRDRECPGCDSSTLGEWDPVLRVFVCPVCCRTWTRPSGEAADV